MKDIVHNVKLAFSEKYRNRFINPCPKRQTAHTDTHHQEHLKYYKVLGTLITKLEQV